MKRIPRKKTAINGHVFDSKSEGDRYVYLRTLQRAGEISDLTLQPKFLLQPRFKMGKKVIRPIEYTPDFRYIQDGKVIIEEFKGFATPLFQIRMKLFLWNCQDDFDTYRLVKLVKKAYTIAEYHSGI